MAVAAAAATATAIAAAAATAAAIAVVAEMAKMGVAAGNVPEIFSLVAQ